MPGPDMLIGVNMAKIAANARMAEANDIIHDIADERDAIAHERNKAILENRRLAAKVRDLEDRLADTRFKKNLAALRATELFEEVRKLDPNAPVVDPSRSCDRARQKANLLLSDPSFGFQGYVFDVEADELRRA